MLKTLAHLPSIRDREQEIRQRLSGRTLAVFLDYDGTLTPIVDDPDRALLADDMRDAVAALAGRCPVAVVSGRDLRMLQRLVGLDGVYYAGSHGFEIRIPQSGSENLEQGGEFLPELDKAEQTLRRELVNIDGHSVERKRFSIAVHYRRVAREEDVDRIAAVVDRVASEHPRLRRGHGKKVFELQPAIDWNKGRAVGWLLERLGLDRPEVVPVYVGDDLTDEDAFRALAGTGITIAVRDTEDRPTAADYALDGTAEVGWFLCMLADLMAATAETGSRS